MGGSKTSDRYKRKACRKIHMGIRSVQIQSAMNNQLEGREAFPRSNWLKVNKDGWTILLKYCGYIERFQEIAKKNPISLTYGPEAIISISKNDVAKDDMGRIKEVDKRRGSKEIASIEEAYYRSKLRRHHNKGVGYWKS
ncbi:hypothetical protein Tco_1122145 [Tanacetum coccineum]|uniref:Uncharacterized protein n=1 Tax=Tanacetum coccineum TaxID=301880 RepID=A0ABQ5IZR5_9ASTR